MFFLILGISKDMKSLTPAIHDKIAKYFVELYGEFRESSKYFRYVNFVWYLIVWYLI